MRYLLFCLSACFSVWAGFFLNEESAQWAYINTGYYFGVALICLWCAVFFRSFKKQWRPAELAKNYNFRFLDLGISVFCISQLFLFEPSVFKLLHDEPIIASIAKRLHEYKLVAHSSSGFDIAGVFGTNAFGVDKRPFLFPLLVSFIHDLTGYRWNQSIIVNGFLGVFCLMGLFSIYRRESRHLAYSCVLLLVSLPLYAQYVTSGSLEILNVFLLILLLIFLKNSWAERSEHTLFLSFLTAIMLCYTRYESVVYLLSPVVFFLLLALRDRSLLKISYQYCLLPLLLLPVAWNQRIIWSDSDRRLLQGKDIDGPFGLQYLYHNIGTAVDYLFSFGNTLTNSWLLSGVGIFACVVLLVFCFSRRQLMVSWVPEVVIISNIFLGTSILLCYYWGSWTAFEVSRLTLPFHLALLIAATTLGVILIKSKSWVKWIPFFLIFYHVSFAVPRLAQHRSTSHYLIREELMYDKIFAESFDEDQNILLVTNNAIGVALYEIPTVSILNFTRSAANEPFPFIALKKFLVDDIYVAERLIYDFDTHSYSNDRYEMPDYIELETVKEYRLSVAQWYRISRVVNIHSPSGLDFDTPVDDALMATFFGEGFMDEIRETKSKSNRQKLMTIHWVKNLPSKPFKGEADARLIDDVVEPDPALDELPLVDPTSKDKSL